MGKVISFFSSPAESLSPQKMIKEETLTGVPHSACILQGCVKIEQEGRNAKSRGAEQHTTFAPFFSQKNGPVSQLYSSISSKGCFMLVVTILSYLRLQ